jgi:hypothetical protein
MTCSLMTPNDIVKLHVLERKKILLGFSLFEASRSPGACQLERLLD